MKLKEFNSKFVYTPDRKGADQWGIPNIEDGFIRDDCEGYALGLRKYVDGMENTEIYFCKFKGQGHVVSKINGMYIDNIMKDFKGTLPKEYTDLRRLSKLNVWWRIFSTKMFGRVLFNKII